MYPKNGSLASHITLDGDPFDVGKPLGIETYVLLTTSSPLSRPKALEFKGVVSRTTSSIAAADPLEELLDAASAGFRVANERGRTRNVGRADPNGNQSLGYIRPTNNQRSADHRTETLAPRQHRR